MVVLVVENGVLTSSKKLDETARPGQADNRRSRHHGRARGREVCRVARSSSRNPCRARVSDELQGVARATHRGEGVLPDAASGAASCHAARPIRLAPCKRHPAVLHNSPPRVQDITGLGVVRD